MRTVSILEPARAVEDLLFERLDRMESEVEPEVVLQDLFFLDRIARPIAGPEGSDYRMPYLDEALDIRRFFASTDARWEAIELYDDLCELCEIDSYDALERTLDRFRAYRRERDAATVRDR